MSVPTPSTKYTEQHILNRSYDERFEVLAFEPMERTGPSSVSSPVSKQTAVKVQTAGTVTYVAKAAIGSDQAAAVWQAKKIDSSSGVAITWADGNADFDNVATDLSLLTYS